MMDKLDTLFVKLTNKLGRRVLIAIILLFIGFTIMQTPNPITHECAPNVRTQMGLSSEGYPLPQHFCETGKYPILKYGQQQAIVSRLIQFVFVLFPLLLLTPVAYILIASHIRNKNSKE